MTQEGSQSHHGNGDSPTPFQDQGQLPSTFDPGKSSELCRKRYSLSKKLSTECVAMKHQGRLLWTVTWLICLVMCFIMYSNSMLWNTIGEKNFPVQESLAIGAARKLLEEDHIAAENSHLEKKLARHLPTCLIVGVRKCGTRAVLEFLGLHPQIKVADREIHFFDNDDNFNKGFDWYRNEMPLSKKGQKTVEKSPRYFIAENAPDRIHKMNSSIKLIVVLKNPTVRVISDYTQVFYNKMAKRKPTERLEDLVINSKTGEINSNFKAVRISMYYLHFERWYKLFRPEQIHIVDGDNLVDHPWVETEKIEKFLGLKHKITQDNFVFNRTKGFHCMTLDGVEKCLSATKGRPHVYTDPVVVDKLKQFFRPYNERLYKVINRTFSWD